jgi:hypothetical protein
MPTIEDRVVEFVDEIKSIFHKKENIDEILKEKSIEFLKASVCDLIQLLKSEPVPESKPKKEKRYVQQKEQITVPEDLEKSNTQSLIQFCKENGLKVSGNKKDLIERGKRFLQGNSSGDDIPSRSKEKKEKVVEEKSLCQGVNAKGTPCANASLSGKVFCWRHDKELNKEPEQKGEHSENVEKKKKKGKVEQIIEKFESEFSENDELVSTDEEM